MVPSDYEASGGILNSSSIPLPFQLLRLAGMKVQFSSSAPADPAPAAARFRFVVGTEDSRRQDPNVRYERNLPQYGYEAASRTAKDQES